MMDRRVPINENNIEETYLKQTKKRCNDKSHSQSLTNININVTIDYSRCKIKGRK